MLHVIPSYLLFQYFSTYLPTLSPRKKGKSSQNNVSSHDVMFKFRSYIITVLASGTQTVVALEIIIIIFHRNKVRFYRGRNAYIVTVMMEYEVSTGLMIQDKIQSNYLYV